MTVPLPLPVRVDCALTAPQHNGFLLRHYRRSDNGGFHGKGRQLQPALDSIFIEDFTLTYDLAQEPIAFRQAPLQVLWGADEEVHRERRGDVPTDPDRLIDFIARRHD